MSQSDVLGAVLDRLLPAVDELGGAGELGLAAKLMDDPLLVAEPTAIDTVVAALPPTFVELDRAAQIEALQLVEQQEPHTFAILISVAYNAYYVDPRTLARIERLTEYKAGAPQPSGYEIEPFDESILDTARRRDPFWREVTS